MIYLHFCEPDVFNFFDPIYVSSCIFMVPNVLFLGSLRSEDVFMFDKFWRLLIMYEF
jgi:hypothetical protein